MINHKVVYEKLLDITTVRCFWYCWILSTKLIFSCNVIVKYVIYYYTHLLHYITLPYKTNLSLPTLFFLKLKRHLRIMWRLPFIDFIVIHCKYIVFEGCHPHPSTTTIAMNLFLGFTAILAICFINVPSLEGVKILSPWITKLMKQKYDGLEKDAGK